MSYISPQSKLFGHMDRLAAIRRGERPAPVNVEIDLSNRCSLGCSWCHFAYTHTRGPLAGKVARPAGAVDGGDLMDKQFAVSMLKDLASFRDEQDERIVSITWTGGGEPTLHPDFDFISGMAFFWRLEQGMYTNGAHIDSKLAEKLRTGFEWVYVSLDECNAEAYKASKGVNKFDKVVDGIRNLMAVQRVNARQHLATIGIGFLLHRENFHQVREMVALGRSLGVDYVQFRPTIRYEQDAPGELAEDTKWISWAVGHLAAYAGDSFVVADIDRFREYQHWQGHGYSTCYWSALQTVITPNGKVWRCTNKREHPSALLGDLSTESFADVWARSGGPCQTDAACRIFCRGHISNVALQPMMAEMPHANFI